MGGISVLFERKLRRTMPLPHMHTSFPPAQGPKQGRHHTITGRTRRWRRHAAQLLLPSGLRCVYAAGARRDQHQYAFVCSRCKPQSASAVRTSRHQLQSAGTCHIHAQRSASSPLILIPSIYQSPRWVFVGHASAQNSRHDVVRTSA